MTKTLTARTYGSPLAVLLFAVPGLVLTAHLIATGALALTLYLLGGVVVLFIGFFHPRIAIYGIIFSMLLSPELGFGGGTSAHAVTVRLEDVFLLVVGVAWLARVAYYKETGLLRKNPLSRPIVAYALAAILATVVSGWLGPVNWLKALLFLAKYLEYFVLYFLVLSMIKSRQDIKRYLAAAIVTCIIVSIVGIAQIPSGHRVSAPFEGEVGEPNTFGGYLVLMPVRGLWFLPRDLLLPYATALGRFRRAHGAAPALHAVADVLGCRLGSIRRAPRLRSQ